MKKLGTLLSVLALGIGAVAQAQVVKHGHVIKTEPKAVKENAAEVMDMPALSEGPLGRLNFTLDLDTLRWHPEYYEEECANGVYSTYYGQGGAFGDTVVPGVFSPYMNGTGEVGATYQTERNVYFMYARIDVSNAWVVGAVVTACRQGSVQGWKKIQHKLGRFDVGHMNEVDGVNIPDMPFKLYGYTNENMSKQTVFKSYTEMIFDNLEPAYIDVEMPLTTEGRAETETFYLRYEPRTSEDGRIGATYYTIGGLFTDQTFHAGRNFGLSFGVELTGDKTYDSLWNSNMGAKSNEECTFVEDWSVWQRFDFRNHERAWVGFWAQDESDIDVTYPWFTDFEYERSGFAPPGCPQKQGTNSLFVYNHSLLRLNAGKHYKPTLYPLVQYSGLVNECHPDTYAQTVSVYPLPATDNVTIVALDPIRKIEVYNMAGTLVKVAEMNDNVLKIDVTSFAPGAYVAKMTTEKGVVSKKLVIK